MPKSGLPRRRAAAAAKVQRGGTAYTRTAPTPQGPQPPPPCRPLTFLPPSTAAAEAGGSLPTPRHAAHSLPPSDHTTPCFLVPRRATATWPSRSSQVHQPRHHVATGAPAWKLPATPPRHHQHTSKEAAISHATTTHPTHLRRWLECEKHHDNASKEEDGARRRRSCLAGRSDMAFSPVVAHIQPNKSWSLEVMPPLPSEGEPEQPLGRRQGTKSSKPARPPQTPPHRTRTLHLLENQIWSPWPPPQKRDEQPPTRADAGREILHATARRACCRPTSAPPRSPCTAMATSPRPARRSPYAAAVAVPTKDWQGTQRRAADSIRRHRTTAHTHSTAATQPARPARCNRRHGHQALLRMGKLAQLGEGLAAIILGGRAGLPAASSGSGDGEGWRGKAGCGG